MRIASIAVLAFLTPLAAQESSWLTNLEEAKAAAAKQKKVILADFTGSDWCTSCARLKDEVFGKPEFQKWASEKVVLLEVDFPKKAELPAELQKQNQQLKGEFQVTEFPTIVFLDAEGKQLGRMGYEPGGPENWTKKADGLLNGAGGESEWMTDYEAALARAKKSKKVVMADFTGSDWCGWCIKLKDEVFSKPEFQEWAKEHVVLLELDFPHHKELPADLKKQNEKLQREFNIEGFPTVLFLDSKGKKVGASGYVPGGPEAWIAAAEKELGIKSKKKRKK
ncbi:MAG TPA: thioredoxin family protein [Planctomycetota bacterium]|nr:thioredoxin family protein [Planctomycetota bacterium]